MGPLARNKSLQRERKEKRERKAAVERRTLAILQSLAVYLSLVQEPVAYRSIATEHGAAGEEQIIATREKRDTREEISG